MNTIVPTSCIAVAGQNLRQWRKLYRNKINMFGKSWTEHVYEFTPASKPISTPDKIGKPYEIRVYKNDRGVVIWTTPEKKLFLENNLSPAIYVGEKNFPLLYNGTTWIGWRRRWKRSFSDVKFLLTLEKTREDFLKKITEDRETYLMYTSKEVEEAVRTAYHKAEEGQGRASIGTYSGPASLSIEELKALSVKACHRPPTRKNPEMAPGNRVSENFNWGASTPKQYQWFRYGAGYRYNGNKGCNSGWVWYG